MLAAGTAASGRMSKAVESDQRYFNVTSAAEYLINRIDKQSYTLKKAAADENYSKPNAIDKSLLSDISLTASNVNDMPDGTEKKGSRSYLLSVNKLDISATSIVADFKAINNNSIMLTMMLSNEDGKAGTTFALYLCFTASLEDWTEKNESVRKVSWNYYSISTVKEDEVSGSPTPTP